MKIGYDLDGVLISDLNWPPSMQLEEFLKLRQDEPFPNFIPKGEYYIVTGRNYTDRPYTENWIKKNLVKNMPYKLFHGCHDFRKAAEYKASVINAQDIQVFIESDLNQVKYLTKNCPNCRVIHFGSFISETFFNL